MLLLGVAAAGLGAARLARLPSLVGYLVAGVVAGPAVLGLLHRTRELETIAELGVALLLFGVGIEFSLEQLRRALPRVLPAAALQLAVTIVAAAALFHGLGLAWPNAVLVGFIVSLSSTAVVFKLYGETGELEAPHGQAAAGILLLQDLALVAMMLLVPALAAPQAGVAGRAGLALVIAAAALAGLLVLARLVLPRALALVARARTPELFPLAALLAAFGTALVAWRVGLSLPIGAFLAGLALSGSPYAHQVFAELLPLRDAFVAVFFTSIGLLFTPEALLGAPGLLVAVLAAVALKAAVTVGVVLLFWRSPVVALQTGLALGQIGEFSFVLATAGYGAHLLGEPLFQAVLGAAILAMAATPFLIRLGWRLSRAGAARPARDAKDAPRDHVLLIGYGETGRAVARVLREIGVPFRAVDLLAEHVEQAALEGIPVQVGDAARRATLDAAGAGAARAAVVAVGDPGATRRIVVLLRQLNPALPVIARAHRVEEVTELERLGANEIVPSEFEASIEIFDRLLRRLGVPRHVVRLQEALIRGEHYRALRGLGAEGAVAEEARRHLGAGLLETGMVMAGSPAEGATLGELRLPERHGVRVLAVVRAERALDALEADTRLVAGDLVVLLGPHQGVAKAVTELGRSMPEVAGGL